MVYRVIIYSLAIYCNTAISILCCGRKYSKISINVLSMHTYITLCCYHAAMIYVRTTHVKHNIRVLTYYYISLQEAINETSAAKMLKAIEENDARKVEDTLNFITEEITGDCCSKVAQLVLQLAVCYGHHGIVQVAMQYEVC